MHIVSFYMHNIPNVVSHVSTILSLFLSYRTRIVK